MRYFQTTSDNPCFEGTALRRFDILIEWLLIALLAFMPLAFGVVHAWSREIVVILSAAITFCFLLKLLCDCQPRIIRTAAYIPLAAFLIVASFQLVPLPSGFAGTISPNTVGIKKELLGDLPQGEMLLKWVTLSFCSYATKQDLRLIMSIAMVFVVVFNVFRRPDQIKRLLMAIAVIGGTVGLITVAQSLFGNGKIYWFVPTRHGVVYSGPFVNHSNYGQFMNLSIGAALAYLFAKLHEDFAHMKISPENVVEHFASAKARTFWILLGIISLGIVTVFISLTRGGIISMLAAMVFTTISLACCKSLKGHSWVMVVVALAAFACILYTGFDAVYQRLASLRNFHEAQSGRLQILKDIAVMWTRFPIFGTGLGTHYLVYPMFDSSTIPALAAHAENEYAQALEETGLVGLGLLVLFGFIIWVNYARCIRNVSNPLSSAAFGLGFGLMAIMVHSLSDFGQHLPANAFLSAIFCALILTLAQHGRREDSILSLKYRLLNAGVFFAIIAVSVWAILGSSRARLAESQWNKAAKIEKNLIEKKWQGLQTEYDALISYAALAAKYDPEKVEYRYWLNVFRWRCLPREIDHDTKQPVLSEDSITIVQNIVEQLHSARVLCPTYGQIYSVAGQIEKLFLNEDRGADDIRKGFRLSPCDAMACFMAGYLDVLEGNAEDSFAKFERAFQLDGNLFKDVADMYIYQLSRPDLAIRAACEDTSRLNYVAEALIDMQYDDLAGQTIEKIKDLLVSQCSGNQVSGWAFESLARIYVRQHKNEAAIDCYRRALAMDYSQVHWRLDLARLLAQTHQIRDAIQETRICLRLRPEFKVARELLEELVVNSAGFSGDVKLP